jgi:hypothetical protein
MPIHKLFDTEGRAWDPHSTNELACSLQTHVSSATLVEFTVRNMGYVAVDKWEKAARVRVRPSITSADAIRALHGWLEDNIVDRVLLTTFDQHWQHTLVPYGHAVTAIAAVLNYPRNYRSVAPKSRHSIGGYYQP